MFSCWSSGIPSWIPSFPSFPLQPTTKPLPSISCQPSYQGNFFYPVFAHFIFWLFPPPFPSLLFSTEQIRLLSRKRGEVFWRRFERFALYLDNGEAYRGGFSFVFRAKNLFLRGVTSGRRQSPESRKEFPSRDETDGKEKAKREKGRRIWEVSSPFCS